MIDSFWVLPYICMVGISLFFASKRDITNEVPFMPLFWIALADVNGFRIDTVKHASFEVCKNFCGAIHETGEPRFESTCFRQEWL